MLPHELAIGRTIAVIFNHGEDDLHARQCEIGLVDDENLGLRDPWAVLARDLVTRGDVDHVDEEIHEGRTESQGQVVTPPSMKTTSVSGKRSSISSTVARSPRTAARISRPGSRLSLVVVVSVGRPEQPPGLDRRQTGNDLSPWHEGVRDPVERMGLHHRRHHFPGDGERNIDPRVLSPAAGPNSPAYSRRDTAVTAPRSRTPPPAAAPGPPAAGTRRPAVPARRPGC